MKGKNIFRFIFILLSILFISLYLGQATGYYKSYDRKDVLTSRAIKKYEKDIKAGKNINISNYLKKEKNYSNSISSLGLKTSNLIESCFNKVLISVFKQVEKEINNKK